MSTADQQRQKAEELMQDKWEKYGIDKVPCDKCKGVIGEHDVEGHYSGVCAHCRGDE